MPAVDVFPTTNKLITDALLLERLTVQLVKNILDFFETTRFITVFKRPVICPYAQPDQFSSRLPSYLS